MEIDKAVFSEFDLFSARLLLNENIIDIYNVDYLTLFNTAKEYYKTDTNSITSNLFVAFVSGYYAALKNQH